MNYINHCATLLLILILSTENLHAQPDLSQVPKRQRRKSPIESEIFLGDWWDYYNRAIRRLDAGDLQGAELDLRQAIKFNDDENPRARTYGVRFQEYYPHAELGAILYESGRYWEAIPELMRSLKVIPLEQTRFYLHEARRQVALRSPIDKKLPSLQITDPPSGLVTNQTRIRIQGVAEDDLFVDRITVSDERQVIERASSKVTFETEVNLPREVNNIPITVYDLMGQNQTRVVTVTVDRQGPVFLEEKIELLNGDRSALLIGTAFDRNTISEIQINGSSLPVRGVTTESIQTTLSITPGQQAIQLTLADGFGNRTHADIPIRQRTGKNTQGKSMIRTAAAIVKDQILAGTNQQGPRIQALDPLPGQRIYSDEVWVNGVVHDPSGILSIRVNEMPVDLPEGKNYRCYFGIAAGSLHPGTNTLRIRATNITGVETIQYYDIFCKIIKRLPPELRLAAAVQGFEETPSQSTETLTQEIRSIFLSELTEQDRFYLIDTKNRRDVLHEREIAESPAADSRMKGPSAGLVSSDLNLSARIFVRPTTMKVFLDITEVETGTTEVLRGFEVKRTENAKENLVHDLAIRLLQRYPLAEGHIIQSVTHPISSLSALDKVRYGMQVIAFKHARNDFVPTGTLTILRVEPTYSLLRPKDPVHTKLSPGDRVVTR